MQWSIGLNIGIAKKAPVRASIFRALSSLFEPLSFHLSRLAGMRFRPKNTSGGGVGLEPFSESAPRSYRALRENKAVVILVVLFVVWVISPLKLFRSLFGTAPKYPPGHPYGSLHVEEVTSPYIYPTIENVDTLMKMGINRLFVEDSAHQKIKPWSSLDDLDPHKQKVKEEADNAALPEARARNMFKNHEKLVFRPKSSSDYPRVVVVSAVDYEKYSVDSLAKILQNRVNYAFAQKYAMYVRYHQEFCSVMTSLNYYSDSERKKWARIYTLRAAMFAYPHAEWFWYLDEDALIMNNKVDILSYLLNPDSMKRALLQEQPIMPPNGAIKTYRNVKPESITVLFTQSADKLETNSFLVRNNQVGRALLDLWVDPLFLNYNSFPYGPDLAISHILQWHPFLLSKVGIIKGRTINSLNSESAALDPNLDHTHYFNGDLVAQWSPCADRKECTRILDKFAKTN